MTSEAFVVLHDEDAFNVFTLFCILRPFNGNVEDTLQVSGTGLLSLVLRVSVFPIRILCIKFHTKGGVHSDC